MLQSMGHITTIVRRRPTTRSRRKKKKTKPKIKKPQVQETAEEDDIRLIPIDKKQTDAAKPIPKGPMGPGMGFFSRPIDSNDNKQPPLQSIPPPDSSQSFIIPKPAQTSLASNYRRAQQRQQYQKQPEAPEEKEKPKVKINKYFRPDRAQKPTAQQSQKNIQSKPVTKKRKVKIRQPRSQEQRFDKEPVQKRTRSLDRDKMEMAMTHAMKILNRDIGPLYKKKKVKKKSLSEEESLTFEQKIPDNLNEILVGLSEIDTSIEASALVDVNGSILAAAVSRRINQALIATIANTLGNIGTDIILSLECGDLQFATLQGSQGTLFLAPIMKNLYLLLLTGPRAKIGVVNIAKTKVKKQVELFFAKRNLRKNAV
ncbi:MAG: hypothetical protein GF364_20880 [Candidatus Lokiarchaeota archaeon]|nr:hypothetical protein [Candidatus Lokiarchaeota archaeon]